MVTNKKLAKIFHSKKGKKPPDIQKLQDKIERLFVKELPKYIPITELDDVQLQFVETQLMIVPLSNVIAHFEEEKANEKAANRMANRIKRYGEKQ